MNRVKKILKRLFIVVGIIICIGFIFLTILVVSQKYKVKELEFANINMDNIQDGVYTGTSSAGIVKVEVKVIVENHRIRDIKILQHDNGFGSKAEKITETMISNNTYEVDAVSGATASSQTIMSAVSNALMTGDPSATLKIMP